VSGRATPLPRNARLHGQALLLRGKGLTVTQIAALLNAPRSTIGGWLRGYGEWSDVRECPLCGERFIATSPKQRFCSQAHAAKHYRVFGAPRAIEAYRQRAQALEDELRELRRIAQTRRAA
jgi:Homeodomain-like domain-containing protein